MENEKVEGNYKIRRRINITQNSKGLGFDCTIEMFDVDNEVVVRETTDLVNRLKKICGG